MQVPEMPEMQENFCGACVAGVTALVGAGAGANQSANNVDPEQEQKNNDILFWISIGVIVVSIIVAIYMLRSCDKCK